MPPETLKWVDIDDFSPGIHSRALRSGTSEVLSRAPGVASVDNTYRCTAIDGGGLGPLWTQDYTLNYDALKDGALGSGREYQITGFYVAQPVAVSNSVRGHEFFFGIEWIDGTNRRFQLRRYRPFTPAWDTELVYVTSTVLPTTDQFINTHFATTRANRTTPTDPGIPVVIAQYAAPTPTNPRRIYQFPDDSTPSTTGVATLFTDTLSGYLIAHQGRILFLESTTYSHGAVGGWLTNDNAVWTVVNDTDTLSSAVRSSFSFDNPCAYACGATMSANELFLVKTHGGAMQIIGDLDDPTVYNLPNVASGAPCIPVATPTGVIFLGSGGGVYQWNGGDNADPISRQLDDYFWKVSGSVLLDHQAGLCMVGTDFVALPRLWLYNLHTGGWWRLDQESNLRQHAWMMQQGYAGNRAPFLYAAVIEFNATNVPIVYGWDCETPSPTYSWQSHPLWVTRHRNITVRQVIVDGIGDGTVTITITGKSGATEAKTYSLASNSQSNRIRRDFSLRGEDITVRIQSDSGDTSPAPIVHAVHIGYIEDHAVEAA